MKVLSTRFMPEPCVLAIGKFESIHRGHNALIRDVVAMAKTLDIASAVMVFTPHPYNILHKDHHKTAYQPLFSREERGFLLQSLGINYLLEYPFDAALMALSPQTFADILHNDLKAVKVVVGEAFHFGYNRTGTVNDLPAVHIVKNIDNISTSSIRALLNEKIPRLDEARKLLGFPYFITGVATQGRQLGRTLGFPTLNLYPKAEKFLPRFGVYATQTRLNGCVYNGVTNIGLRPTVSTTKTVPSVETHLFDFKDDAYGCDMHVAFLHFIRDEQKFNSLEDLKQQINVDVIHAKRILI